MELPVSPSGACWSTESRTPNSPLGYILSSDSLGTPPLITTEQSETTAFTEREGGRKGGGETREGIKGGWGGEVRTEWDIWKKTIRRVADEQPSWGIGAKVDRDKCEMSYIVLFTLIRNPHGVNAPIIWLITLQTGVPVFVRSLAFRCKWKPHTDWLDTSSVIWHRRYGGNLAFWDHTNSFVEMIHESQMGGHSHPTSSVRTQECFKASWGWAHTPQVINLLTSSVVLFLLQ